MFAEIALMAVLGLARFETPEILQQPTPAPPQEMSMYVCHGRFQLPSWWRGINEPHYQVTWYRVAPQQESGPSWWPGFETTDPWGATVVLSPVLDTFNVIPLSELMDRAREEAEQIEEPVPCFPGEYTGDGAW